MDQNNKILTNVILPDDIDPDFISNIEKLTQLTDGWKNGEGKAVNIKCLEMAVKISMKLKNDFQVNNLPHLYVSDEGGIDLTWAQAPKLYCTIEVDDNDEIVAEIAQVEDVQYVSKHFNIESDDVNQTSLCITLREHLFS